MNWSSAAPSITIKYSKMSKEKEKELREAHVRSEQSKIETFDSWIIDSTGDDPKYEDDCGCGCEDSCDT